MIQSLSAINWVSVLVAFLSYTVLGTLWFTLFFKKPYLISLGKENEPQQKPAPIFFIGPMLCMLIICITSALFMQLLEINSLGGALEFACIAGIGYLFANTVNIAINPNIPKPMMYGIITGMFHLVGMSIACTIMVALA